MHTKFLFGAILAFLFLSGYGQANFIASDTIKFLNKDTGFGVLHEYITLHNNTTDSLLMRWRKRVLWAPVQWVVTFQDPDVWHNPVNGIDSADFVLPDSSNAVNNKLIIGVDHQHQPGYGQYIFTVYERSAPADSVRLYFDVVVRSKPVNLPEWQKQMPTAYPNPAVEKLYFTPETPVWEVRIFNAKGENYYFRVQEEIGEKFIDISCLPSGSYTMQVIGEKNILIKKIIIL